VPSNRIVVECERRRPLWGVSADFALGSSRLFASDTPLENANQLATAQTTTSRRSTRRPMAIRRPQRGRRATSGRPPGPRYRTREPDLSSRRPPPSRLALAVRDDTEGTFPLARPPR